MAANTEEKLLRKRHVMVIAMLALTLLAVGTPRANAQFTYTVLHTFTGSPDGVYPSPLIRDSEGNLYGTAQAGGSDNSFCAFGCGMVFKIDPAGKLTALYDFTGGTNGGYPIAGLVQDKAGNFYGTTQGLGDSNLSVVFKLTPDGKETSYDPPNSDSIGSLASPVALDGKGNLYGMSPYGGTPNCGWDREELGCGTLFKMTASGKFSIVHTFDGTDGMNPQGGLVRDAKGNLYGAAFFGGIRTCTTTGNGHDEPGCGTIFKIDVDGEYTVLHTFTGHQDGAGPQGLIIDSDGNLYGIAQNGGNHGGNGHLYGLGTIFKVDSSGKFSVLFTFTPEITESVGYANLLARDSTGNLYGAKQYDGANNAGCLFEIDTEGNYTDLFDFADTGQENPGGYRPISVVLGSAGDFYGSMALGGSSAFGTVFHIAP
jgi:uncharacterized repeat protein (TIGR03803 family)